ncbi:MAG: hypothetical protein H0X37_23890, partial [Herpetosiphonaceae bacterium]|nr:hypothetical protein [Herpetosiphonaceae bacterium]
PAVVHHEQSVEVRSRRQAVLTAAHLAHPERFAKGTPCLPALPSAVWINPPVPAAVPDPSRSPDSFIPSFPRKGAPTPNTFQDRP